MVFHVELRRFPHSFWRFNLTDEQLKAEIVGPWASGALLEAGERHWDPRTATLTVLEGPRLEVQELSLGRGWRNAQRRSEDVTARVLAQGRPADRGDLRGLLGEDAQALVELWRAARERHPGRTPSECLALAEEALRALADR